MKNKIFNLSILAAILLSVFLSISDVQAQTSRRRKKVRPQPIATPTQTPAVVSENQPYIDGNQIVLGETPQPPESSSQSIPVPPEPVNTENGT